MLELLLNVYLYCMTMIISIKIKHSTYNIAMVVYSRTSPISNAYGKD